MSLKENAREELFDFNIASRVQSMLLSLGLIAFGVALGVKWAAVQSVPKVAEYMSPKTALLPILAEAWNTQMTMMLIAAGVCLVLAVAIDAV